MSDKRHIVTEQQLQELIASAVEWATSGSITMDTVFLNCKKIEIPSWATHFADITIDSDGHEGHWYVLNKSEEIPK